MPELPEVETVKSVLKPIVVGRTITGIDVLRESSVPGDTKTFISSLKGEKFLDLTKKSTFYW